MYLRQIDDLRVNILGLVELEDLSPLNQEKLEELGILEEQKRKRRRK